MSQDTRYPNIPYNTLQTPDTPQGSNSRDENPEPRINPQLNFTDQQQQQLPQLQAPPQMYYMPVQGPNGIMYMPIPAQYPQIMPVQGQVVQNVPPMQNIPQGQVFYGYPMMAAPRIESSECNCFSRLVDYFRNMTQTDKYRFVLNVLSVLSFIAIILSVKVSIYKWHRAQGIFGLILSLFFFITFRKGVKSIKTKDIKGFKRFLKMAWAIFIINVYNLVMYLVFGHGRRGKRCFGGIFGLILMAALSGYLCCKGKKLFRRVLKPEWRQAQNLEAQPVN